MLAQEASLRIALRHVDFTIHFYGENYDCECYRWRIDFDLCDVRNFSHDKKKAEREKIRKRRMPVLQRRELFGLRKKFKLKI